MTKALTLIAPEIAPAWRQAIAERSSRWPHLARLGGRGSIRALPPPSDGLRVWQIALLSSLGIDDHAQYPSAAVTCTGDTAEPARDFWLHLQPMHFVAGLDRLTAVVLHGSNGVARAELAELEPTLAAHLRAAGMQLVTTSRGHWLVHSPHALDVQT
ncbi:MAG TPA: hypothetical protein VJT80_20995, partial [Steroidobacteraceae bacterium]|nr:hypothetical protein [Steroidobacteraceae bacterium]